MSLEKELRLPNPLGNEAHETVLEILYTASLIEKQGNRLLRDLELTDAQFNVLMLLHYQSGVEGLTQSRLGEMLLVNRSNVTGLVDRMERDGLVRREPDPEDRRVNRVRITDRGHELLKKAADRYHEWIDRIVAPLGVEERKRLVKSMKKVRTAL